MIHADETGPLIVDWLRGQGFDCDEPAVVPDGDPADPAWATTAGADEEKLRGAVDVLITALLEDRATARADKDWARADAIRDRIKAAGIEIEDTPSGPKWSI